MAISNKELIHRWFEEVWNKGQESTIDELLAANAIAHGLSETDADVHGPDQFKVFARNLRGTLENFRIDVEDIVSEGDRVAARVLLHGDHPGDAAAAKRRVRVAGIVIVRILNGQIVEGWNSWDQLGLLRQIGALPHAGATDRFLTERG